MIHGFISVGELLPQRSDTEGLTFTDPSGSDLKKDKRQMIYKYHISFKWWDDILLLLLLLHTSKRLPFSWQSSWHNQRTSGATYSAFNDSKRSKQTQQLWFYLLAVFNVALQPFHHPHYINITFKGVLIRVRWWFCWCTRRHDGLREARSCGRGDGVTVDVVFLALDRQRVGQAECTQLSGAVVRLSKVTVYTSCWGCHDDSVNRHKHWKWNHVNWSSQDKTLG